MKWIVFVPALLLAAPALAVEDGAVLAFNAAGQEFGMPVPAGYCPPEGEDIAVARRVAAMDPVNETPIDLQRCGTAGDDYVLVKYPKAGGVFEMDRAMFLALVAAELEAPGADAILSEGAELANEGIADATANRGRVDIPDFGYTGTDDICAYLSGTITVQLGESSRQGLAASCITLVGERNLVIHVYNFLGTASVEELRAHAATIARSIEPG